MEAFLGTITQHAMNYAIRSGIGITASYAIRQTSRLLKNIDENNDYKELHSLQECLDSKIRIISPAIDMIEIISARGNTTLESAVTLAKSLRWDIQSLGDRLAKAASVEESSRRNSGGTEPRVVNKVEIRLIVLDIQKLLARIEDAVPLINLAITTSGARLSTTLPATVSPSRLLQASTFITAGDSQYSLNASGPVHVGPAFTLSLYMLFASHAHRVRDDNDGMRSTTWKEVIHKARVKLLRIPLHLECMDGSSNTTAEEGGASLPFIKTIGERSPKEESMIAEEERASEFAYQLEIIEDLDDDRVHSFEDSNHRPGPYGDVRLAGIREILPIHQISKIFYADTGKILNIGSDGESSSPVLLLKRDISALPPRRMMQESEMENGWYDDHEDVVTGEEDNDSQEVVDRQIRRESLLPTAKEGMPNRPAESETAWKLPANLDSEWLAFEVYAEEADLSSEDDQDKDEDSAYAYQRAISPEEVLVDSVISTGLASLNLDQQSPHLPTSIYPTITPLALPLPTQPSLFGPIRSSLSLLEMLIRLTSLQQFQQASHLSIPDELLTFFLEESSTTGAGGDGEERRRTRREARRKVGFDPYDESPVKRRGEDYQFESQAQEGYGEHSRDDTPYDAYDQREGHVPVSGQWPKERSMTPEGTPEPWLLRSRELSSSSREGTRYIPPSSPISSYRAPRKATRPLDRVQQDRRGVKAGSPLGRGMSVETDSTLGTSPGSPTLTERR